MRKWFIVAGVTFVIGLTITAVFNSSSQVPLFVGQVGGLLTSVAGIALFVALISGIRQWRQSRGVQKTPDMSETRRRLKEAKDELALLETEEAIRKLREAQDNQEANPQRRGRRQNRQTGK